MRWGWLPGTKKNLKGSIKTAQEELKNKCLKYELAAPIAGSCAGAIMFRRHIFKNLTTLAPPFRIHEEIPFYRIIKPQAFRMQLNQAYPLTIKYLGQTPPLAIGAKVNDSSFKNIFYTDASFENGIAYWGGVFTRPGTNKPNSPEIISWFTPKPTPKNTCDEKVTTMCLEALAVILATKLFNQSNFTLAVDNQAAAFAFSKAPVHPQGATLMLLGWNPKVLRRHFNIFYVPSAGNVGGPPTRMHKLATGAVNSLLSQNTQCNFFQVKKMLKHALPNLMEKMVTRHAPHSKNLTPQFIIEQPI